MANTIKRYRLLKGFQLSTIFLVNGVKIPVTFQNGIRKPYLARGWFMTSDPNLQDAIESDNSYGNLFALEGETNAPIPEEAPVVINEQSEKADDTIPENAPAIEEETPVEDKTEEEVSENKEEIVAEEAPAEDKQDNTLPENTTETDDKPEVPEFTDYPEITNLQEARQKLIALFPTELKLSNLPNQKAVLNRAKEKKITFSKLV